MTTRVPEASFWVDGEWLDADQAVISITDPAFLSGLGLFETIALRQGIPLELAEHLDRLRISADRLSIPLPDHEILRDAVLQSGSRIERPYGWLKMVATRGGRCVIFTGELEAAEVGKAVSAVLLPWRRNPHDPLAGLKTLNYAPNQLGLERAAELGADEGLWLNTRGHLAEGSISNIFVIQHRRLYTPAVSDGILPGVVREQVVRAARLLGLDLHIGKIRLRRLERAAEAFLTSSLRGIRPLLSIDGRPVGNGRTGPLTRTISATVERLRLGQPMTPDRPERSAKR